MDLRRMCVVVISHDRWFLDRIATHMLAFEGDSRCRRGSKGNYQDYEADRSRRRLGGDADTASPDQVPTHRRLILSASRSRGDPAYLASR